MNIIILFRRISDKKLLINFLSIHSSSSVDLSRGGGGSGLRRSASICDIRPLTETSNVYYATVSFSKYFKTFLRTIFSAHFLQKTLTFNWCCFESRSIKIIFKFWLIFLFELAHFQKFNSIYSPGIFISPILIFNKPSLGSFEVLHKIRARSVLPSWKILDKNGQTNKQTWTEPPPPRYSKILIPLEDIYCGKPRIFIRTSSNIDLAGFYIISFKYNFIKT